jgi:C-terminal processing protease CtpA/Prc
MISYDSNSAIATMLASLGDPKTRFRPRADLDDDSANRHGKYLGLGMNLWVDRNNKIKITNVTDSSPAFKAGIHTGDEITAVNGKPAKGAPKLDPNGLKDMQLLRAISFLHDAASAQNTSDEKDSDGKTPSR